MSDLTLAYRTKDLGLGPSQVAEKSRAWSSGIGQMNKRAPNRNVLEAKVISMSHVAHAQGIAAVQVQAQVQVEMQKNGNGNLPASCPSF